MIDHTIGFDMRHIYSLWNHIFHIRSVRSALNSRILCKFGVAAWVRELYKRTFSINFTYIILIIKVRITLLSAHSDLSIAVSDSQRRGVQHRTLLLNEGFHYIHMYSTHTNSFFCTQCAGSIWRMRTL